MTRSSLLAVLATLFLLLPSLGFAQDDGSTEVIEDSAPIKIQGERHAPEAFYILENRDLEFEDAEQRQSFIKQLLKSSNNEVL